MRKLTKNEFINNCVIIHGFKYDYSEVYYKNNRSEISIICKEHGKFNQLPNSHLNGSGCPKCGIIKRTLSNINNNWLNDFKSVHFDLYDYSMVEYINSRTKVKIICKIHGEFEQTPNNHLKGQKCPHCNGKPKLNKIKFCEKSNNIHNNKYDYSMVDYVNNKTNVKIICKIHGEFEQTPANHFIGQGCSLCSGNKNSNTLEFIEKSNNTHNNKYDYSLVEYKNSHIKVKIICKEHGIFEQLTTIHIGGSGCSHCSDNKKSNTLEFIKRSNNTHNNKYDYSMSEYNNSHTKVKIICEKHGIFNQKPYKHYNGRGCPECGVKFGVKENRWLDKLGIVNRQVKIGKYIVDGYDKTTNTIYEFNGDYWHGNPNKYKHDDINNVLDITFGELYNKTINRKKYLINKGYNVISIWESDFIYI
jgi:hypothetical protein